MAWRILRFPVRDRCNVCSDEGREALRNIRPDNRITSAKKAEVRIRLDSRRFPVDVESRILEVTDVTFHLASGRLGFVRIANVQADFESSCLLQVGGAEVVVVDTGQRMSCTVDRDGNGGGQHFCTFHTHRVEE